MMILKMITTGKKSKAYKNKLNKYGMKVKKK